MLSSSFESEKTEDSDVSNGELLREIEEISKALYLEHKTHQNSLISSSDLVPKSTFPDLNLNPKMGFSGVDEWLLEDKKRSSIWDWKPLKAFSHIRRRKFTSCFFCHVHCIKNLPSEFDGISISVHWKRKDNVLRTLASRVLNGVVEFEEILTSKCTVYGVKNGHGNFVKYEPKHFLLYASIVGAGGLDIGKHWVDLTRLLPVTIEELEDEKCSGRWSTSFKLAGQAKGATLHVSFAFLVMNSGLAELDSNTKLPLFLSTKERGLKRLSFVGDFEPSKGDAMLGRISSVHSLTNISSNPLDSMELKFEWPKDIYDFSNSVNMLYGKLEEGSAGGSTKLDVILEELESLKLASNSFSCSRRNFGGAEYDEAGLLAIDKAMELEQNPDNKVIILDESSVADLDVCVVEVIDVADIFNSEETSSNEDTKPCIKSEGITFDRCTDSNMKDGSLACVANDDLMVKNSAAHIDDSDAEKEELDFEKMLFMEYAELNFSMNKSSSDNEVNHNSSSLDDVAKSVTDDFLKLLQEASQSVWSSNGDLESPREQLLRQFEEDMMISGSFFSGFAEDQEKSDNASPSVSSLDYSCEGIDILPALDIPSHKSVNQLSKSKMKAKTLEHLETESLMQRWGLNEDAFLSSPHYSTGGFGSPVYVPPKKPIGLPPLGDSLGSLLHLKNGGLLRSMSPLLFENVKKCGSLAMQVSKPVVLPRELGSDIMDILQCMASAGVYKLCKQLHELMPLEELSEMIIHQLAWQTSCKVEPLKRSVSLHGEFDVKIEDEGASQAPQMESDGVFAKDLAFLALNSIEVLAIEGLRIQCAMSDQEAPSIIKVKSTNEVISQNMITFLDEPSDLFHVNYVEELLDLSISLDDWLSLDAVKFGDKNENPFREKESQNEILKCWFWGDSHTVAIMVQLRDSHRNYEPVGPPMLGLIQVDRSLEGEGGMDNKHVHNELSNFTVNKVHIAGLNIGHGNPEIWASKRQRQSGPRWLLASGLTKNQNRHISETSLVIRQPTQVCTWARNFMWSISHQIHGVEADLLELSTRDPTRNPDIMFPEEGM